MSKGRDRNIVITPKGYRILAALDAGTYRTLSTNEARALAGRRQSRINNAKRRRAA